MSRRRSPVGDRPPILTTLEIQDNPALECIKVADAAAANAGTGIYSTWTKDAGAVYSESCQEFIEIFSDGFESNDTSAWSMTVPTEDS